MSLRTMSGFIQGTNLLLNKNYDFEKKQIFKDLMDIVKECQSRFGGKTELATENDPRIIKLCDLWESALIFGLKTSTSILKNVTDLVTLTTQEQPALWNFAYLHLTAHEKERFSTLRHVWTDRGKGRALIRAALNERALERYILVWLSEGHVKNCYEIWSLLRDEEITNLLPSMAAGLNSILFAISVDCPELNTPPKINNVNSEPVIALPEPIVVSRKKTAVEREIITLNDTNTIATSNSTNSLLSSSLPKSLSSLCIKYSDPNNTNIVNQNVAINPIKRNHLNVAGVMETPSVIQFIETNTTTNKDDELTSPIDSGIVDPSEGSIASIQSKNSSINGSTSSIESLVPITDINLIKIKLKEKEEHCNMLEARIAELSLENHRLRGLTNSSRYGLSYFTISVPRVLLQKTNKLKYYAYEVHIIPTHGGDEWTVLRRYSDFYKLHKKFKKDNIGVQALDFPPKKNFGNMDAQFVEQRRQRLQVYLRHLLTILPEVASCTTRSHLEMIFPFFK